MLIPSHLFGSLPSRKLVPKTAFGRRARSGEREGPSFVDEPATLVCGRGIRDVDPRGPARTGVPTGREVVGADRSNLRHEASAARVAGLSPP